VGVAHFSTARSSDKQIYFNTHATRLQGFFEGNDKKCSINVSFSKIEANRIKI
jgi:hypothetical protein